MGGDAAMVAVWLAEEAVPRMEAMEEAPMDLAGMHTTMDMVVAAGGATSGEVGDHPIVLGVEDPAMSMGLFLACLLGITAVADTYI